MSSTNTELLHVVCSVHGARSVGDKGYWQQAARHPTALMEGICVKHQDSVPECCDKGPLAAGGKASYGSEGGHSGGSSDIPFSKPRPVDYSPYGLKDFEDKDYNVKKAGYWQLGRLGPDLATEELQAKRENQERVKAMAAQVREDNLKAAAVAAVKPKKEIPKEPSARERALQFAKNVPKPDPAKAQPHVPLQQHKGPPRKGQPADSKIGKGRPSQPVQQAQQQQPQQQQQQARGTAAPPGHGQEGSAAAPDRPPMSELEMLEAQHEADLKRVEEIRAQLARACK
ncbi:hypothetical protein DUNSADRAFT_208 [Dunaliella salina]|uniref:Uncharacterized protein n=1 Tax=Dunaliella salina TaxID=3046 RepID=A0ABQ7GYI2_DUNSA|nr:hypothetical protein DUNSADRAFT_208 [Dunaliella salina]|eukprot:KAF5839657.1 hypothetical protein DUNSADRAFT_208 [Dunaliella salina]